MWFSNEEIINELMSVKKSCIFKYVKRKTKDNLHLILDLVFGSGIWIWYLKLENGILNKNKVKNKLIYEHIYLCILHNIYPNANRSCKESNYWKMVNILRSSSALLVHEQQASQKRCLLNSLYSRRWALLRAKHVCYYMLMNSSPSHRTCCVPRFYISGYQYLAEATALLKDKDVWVSSFKN